MVDLYFSAKTLDDLMRTLIDEIRSRGGRITPTKGPASELTGVLLEVTDPRARISRTETRGKPFSCLGELCWYLAGTNDLGFISYYLPQYTKYADGDSIFGGYGPRLFNWRGLNQVNEIADLLSRKPDSRQAVIQLFDASDLQGEHKDIPCTCTLQFMVRRHELHMVTYMRSNDALWGLPHDIFCFTMLQELMSRTLSVELGTYKHAVGSLHLYDKSTAAARKFLDEGWQATDMPMPPMPAGDPWPAVTALLHAESVIRTEVTSGTVEMENLDPYWQDLIRLLQIFRCWKKKNSGEIRAIRGRMSSHVYDPFIEGKLSRLP